MIDNLAKHKVATKSIFAAKALCNYISLSMLTLMYVLEYFCKARLLLRIHTSNIGSESIRVQHTYRDTRANMAKLYPLFLVNANSHGEDMLPVP